MTFERFKKIRDRKKSREWMGLDNKPKPKSPALNKSPEGSAPASPNSSLKKKGKSLKLPKGPNIAEQEANLLTAECLEEGAKFERDINNIISII